MSLHDLGVIKVLHIDNPYLYYTIGMSEGANSMLWIYEGMWFLVPIEVIQNAERAILDRQNMNSVYPDVTQSHECNADYCQIHITQALFLDDMQRGLISRFLGTKPDDLNTKT